MMVFNVRSFNSIAKNMFRCAWATFKCILSWLDLSSIISEVVMRLLIMTTAVLIRWFFYSFHLYCCHLLTLGSIFPFLLLGVVIFLYKFVSLLIVAVFAIFPDDGKDEVVSLPSFNPLFSGLESGLVDMVSLADVVIKCSREIVKRFSFLTFT